MHIPGRFPLGVTGVVAAIVLAALPIGCAQPRQSSAPTRHPVSATPSPSPAPASSTASPSRAAGWHKVAIDGSVRSISHSFCSPAPDLLAAGADGGKPLLVAVTHGLAQSIVEDLPKTVHNGIGVVVSEAENIFVTEEVDPALSKPATLWLDLFPVDVAHPELTSNWTQIWDAQGAKPVWLSPLVDGEMGQRAVGAVQAGDRWELHAWQSFEHWTALDRGQQLYVHAKPSSQSVLTGSTETTVIAAGAISDQPGRPGGSPQVWIIEDEMYESHGRWTQYPMASTPDGLTDIADWELGWWVAGHRNLRPVVYDFNEKGGASMPVPNTSLDPDRPVVYFAGVPVKSPMVLATQSVDGPTVWVQKGRDWQRIPAPSGQLEAAQTASDGVYLLIDGALWFREVPGFAC